MKLSSRAYVRCPFTEKEFGTITPRAFKVFNTSTICDGGYFSAAVDEWFETLYEKVDFLNKFYQCLLVHQLPHKTRKLVLVGDSDSGKSSLVNILFGIIPQSKIAIVTKESNFGLSMIGEDTELLYIDEWCTEMMAADTVKTLFQGGAFPQSIKHRTPKMQCMKAGVFVTCNSLPNFNQDQKNVERRLAFYETSELSQKSVEAPEWMKENCMNCITWMMNYLNRNQDIIPTDERFYELSVDVLSLKSRLEEKIPIGELDQIISCSLQDVVVTRSKLVDNTSCELFKKNQIENGMCTSNPLYRTIHLFYLLRKPDWKVTKFNFNL